MEESSDSELSKKIEETETPVPELPVQAEDPKPEPEIKPIVHTATNPKPVERKEIAVNERGIAITKSIEDQFRLATAYARSAVMPKTINSADKVLVALQMSYAFGLEPALAIRQMVCIGNTISIWGELPKAIVMKSGWLEKMEEYLIDPDGKRITVDKAHLNPPVFGAICRVKRRGDEWYETIFTMEDAKIAGLLGKDIWMKYPKRMLQMRARSQAFKDIFPDVLSGVSIAEYDYHTDGTMQLKDVGGTSALQFDDTAVEKIEEQFQK